MRRLWLLGILLIAPSVSGCGCEAIGFKRLDPSAITLSVGTTAPAPQAVITGCLEPRRTVVEVERWTSENPAVASVDAESGVITGMSPGETTINAFSDGSDGGGSFDGTLSVTVVP